MTGCKRWIGVGIGTVLLAVVATGISAQSTMKPPALWVKLTDIKVDGESAHDAAAIVLHWHAPETGLMFVADVPANHLAVFVPDIKDPQSNDDFEKGCRFVNAAKMERDTKGGHLMKSDKCEPALPVNDLPMLLARYRGKDLHCKRGYLINDEKTEIIDKDGTRFYSCRW